MAHGKRSVGVLALVAATYFMVSGGPYGLEELVAAAGYTGAMIALVVTPVVWSLPTALMIGELASAIPEQGGYYAWVRRALGPFWGFQEAWLSLAASVFDMAIYPTLFTLYLARLWPAAGEGATPIVLGAAMIAACAAYNLSGARGVGGASIALTIALLAPFAALAVATLARAPALAHDHEHAQGLVAGILVAMWNYMGWDNASTIASEVHRPQRTYPIAMTLAVALVALTYVVPVAAVARAGVDPTSWKTGAWVSAGEALGGKWLGVAIVVGGVVCGVGMFNALLMSYARVPAALAEHGYLPRALARKNAAGTPYVALAACSIAYASCLGLGFRRLVELDVLVYGASLVLEFVALVALRVKEPALARPFRVPGGLAGAVVVGVVPTLLLLAALASGAREEGGALGLELGAGIIACGPIVYLARRRRASVSSSSDPRRGP